MFGDQNAQFVDIDTVFSPSRCSLNRARDVDCHDDSDPLSAANIRLGLRPQCEGDQKVGNCCNNGTLKRWIYFL
jgi:hypothetical protein